MKIVIPILSLLLFSCVTNPHDKTPLNDENIRKLLIGTWVCAPSDQRCFPSRSTYHNDGTLEFVRYKTQRCEIPVNETTAQWRVKNRRVIIVVQKSIGSVLFEPGLTTVSEVVAISEGELTLLGQKGQMNYRVKSERCVSVEGE